METAAHGLHVNRETGFLWRPQGTLICVLKIITMRGTGVFFELWTFATQPSGEDMYFERHVFEVNKALKLQPLH
jgi:hypothetical protein